MVSPWFDKLTTIGGLNPFILSHEPVEWSKGERFTRDSIHLRARRSLILR